METHLQVEIPEADEKFEKAMIDFLECCVEFSEVSEDLLQLAITKIDEVLKTYGETFSFEFWKTIFKGVLKPLIDNINFLFQQKQSRKQQKHKRRKQKDPLKVICEQAFKNMVTLFDQYYDNLYLLLEDFIEVLTSIIQNSHEAIAKISIQSFKALIMKIGPKLQERDWDFIITTIE